MSGLEPGPVRGRDLFSLPRDVHYLNCAYLAPLPCAAEEAGIAAIRERRAPVGYPAGRFFEESDRLRELFARLIGAPDPSRVALQPSVSYGIAVAARNVEARRGQNVVLLEQQFPSNVYAWRRLATERGLEVRTVARPPAPGGASGGRPGGSASGGGAEPTGPRWTARVLETIDRDTAVVALPQVHWTDGTLLDLEAVGARAREMGAALVVDGSQSVGAYPFDVSRVRPDALVCAGYKWLLGPYTLCLAWFGPRFDGGVPLEETWIARRGSDDFQGLALYQDEYRPGAARYDMGERSNLILVPMLTASLRVVLGWTPERVQAHCRALLVELLAAARERGAGLETEGRAAHIAGIRLPPRADPRALQRRLEERHVHVSLRGDALRVSPNLYNDEADVEPLRETLLEAL